MSYMNIRVKSGRFVRKGMNDAVFLNIASPTDPDKTDISPQNSPGPDVRPRLDHNIPDKYGLGMHKGLGIDIGPFALERIKSHLQSPKEG